MTATGKFCPVCKNENEDTASVCRHCGARLEEQATGYVGISENHEIQIESSINVDLIPEEGIGIHVAGEIKPLYVPIRKEIVLGRTREATPASDTFLDLTNLNAGTLGVSKRHAMIRRTTSGYEVTDLSSRNGSWLNAERLIPNKPYPLSNGSQLRIGNMRLLIMYRTVKSTSE